MRIMMDCFSSLGIRGVNGGLQFCSTPALDLVLLSCAVVSSTLALQAT
jgi:hypothetical protein